MLFPAKYSIRDAFYIGLVYCNATILWKFKLVTSSAVSSRSGSNARDILIF